jgi:hypothetical protein
VSRHMLADDRIEQVIYLLYDPGLGVLAARFRK